MTIPSPLLIIDLKIGDRLSETVSDDLSELPLPAVTRHCDSPTFTPKLTARAPGGAPRRARALAPGLQNTDRAKGAGSWRGGEAARPRGLNLRTLHDPSAL